LGTSAASTRVYRRDDAGRGNRPAWARVLAVLVAGLVVGTAAGLLVPINGRSTAALLAARQGHALSLPLPAMPWQRRGEVTDAERQFVLDRGLFGRVTIPLHNTPATAWRGLTLPTNGDAPPPPSPHRRMMLPLLGPDPLAMSAYHELRRNDLRLQPRGIEPIARLAHVPVIMYHDVVSGTKDVWFDISVEEFDRDLELIAQRGCTPISLKQWWNYITTGAAVPAKPVLLTFDDGYGSVYDLIYPRLKQRGWPAVFFITTSTVGRTTGKPHVTWDQIREMRKTGLFEFQAHSVTHPYLTQQDDESLHREIYDCRDALERELGEPIQFFCYPIGDRDERVISAMKQAGFIAGFTMAAGGSAQSPGIMEINRYPNQELPTAVEASSGAMIIPAPDMWPKADLGQPLVFRRTEVKRGANRIPICWVSGGSPITVHADFRYGVPDVARMAGAPAGINGGFFQMAHVRDVSNAMIGPVMARMTTTRNDLLWDERGIAEPLRLLGYDRFVPGSDHDNQRLSGRPLVLMSPTGIRFVPFDGTTMNSRQALRLLLPDVTDAFIGGGWLVREGRALSREAMDLVATGDHHDPRRRAFFGIDRAGRPVIGASPSSQSSETVADCLAQLGLAQAVLLDSGFSSSLYYDGSIFVTGHSDEKPSRPVPHIILLQNPSDPARAAAGEAATRVGGLLRSARDDSHADDLPPRSRLVDQPDDGLWDTR